MRACPKLAPLAACLAIAGIASGCGVSGSPPPSKQVGLVLTAPINGATVGVRKIQIAGNVTPRDAAVTVAGQVVQVRNGSFALPMALAGASQTITVTARAPGYNSATSRTTVSYSSQTATEIASAIAAETARTVAKTLTPPRFVLAPVAGKTPAKTPAKTPGSTANSSPSTVLALPGSGHPRSPTSTPTPTPRSTSGGAPGSPPTVTPSPPAPAPQPLLWTAADIHRIYVGSCVQGNGGHPVLAFCQCTYKQIALAGGLRSRASLFGLVRSLRPYERTHNLALLPAYVRRALLSCVQFLPDNNVAAKPVITRLPSLSHRRLAAPSGP